MPRIHVTGIGVPSGFNNGQIPQMPQYQQPQYDPSEADDEAQLEQMNRQIPEFLRNPGNVTNPFDRLAAAGWGLSNSHALDSYNKIAERVAAKKAGRQIQGENLKLQGMQQQNQFNFEDQQQQNATFGRNWNEHSEDRVFEGQSREHQKRMWPMQEQSAKQNAEMGALNIGEKKEDIANKVLDKNAILGILKNPNLEVGGTFDRLAQMDAEDNVDIRQSSPAMQHILGGGVSSPLTPVQQESRASVMEQGLRSKISADATRTAGILQGGGSVGLFQAMLGDHERRAGVMAAQARSTADSIINDEFKRRDDIRQNKRLDVDIKLRAANEINTSRRLDMQQQTLDLNSRKLDMLSVKPQIDALNRQEIEINRTLRNIATDGTGRYKTDDKTVQGLRDKLKDIKSRQRAYEAQNGGEPVNAFVPSIGTDGSVTMTFDGQTARIDAKRRREIEADIKQANPGIRYGSDEFNQILLDHLQQEAVGASEPKKSGGVLDWLGF